MTRYYQIAIPANNGEYVYIAKSGVSFDKNGIDPGMIGHRLTREEIDLILDNINAPAKHILWISLAVVIVWLLSFLYGINSFFDSVFSDPTNATKFDMRYLFIGWFFFIFIYTIVINKVLRKKVQNAIDQENNLRLHPRGLHAILGPQNAYLTIHLNYSTQPTITTGFPAPNVPYGYAQPPNQYQQPFLAPGPGPSYN
eukprot:TRINITY_DN0_c3016_g1_i2.p1 TRINITY_DN0_c3016_g1~~TRINITY_DN0_c3016_g1_i2.p1  ORF type:complete len:198 (+),score=51.40 TRINITY_DN0_c3016_g1_i2:34-627(+)